jgi:hypothetical protein
MNERKTPVLLRRGPLSGDVMALLRYTRKQTPRGEILMSSAKQDVTADFTVLMLEELLDGDEQWPASPDIVSILDGVADGESLTDDERLQVRAFRERLALACLRHNERGHGKP